MTRRGQLCDHQRSQFSFSHTTNNFDGTRSRAIPTFPPLQPEISCATNKSRMAFNKGDEPPPYAGGHPAPPQQAYGGSAAPYQGSYSPGPQQQYQQPHQQYYQPGPQMGYYNQQQGPYPAGQGPYPPPNQYGQPNQYGPPQGYYQGGPGYMPQDRRDDKGGLMGGLLAGLACCCCLDCLLF